MKKQFLLISILLLIFLSSTYGQGTRYTGPYTPSGAINWGGVSNKVIDGLSFTGLSQNNINLWECTNITIQNCKFSKSAFRAISAENSKNLIIQDCVFDSVADGILSNSNASNPFNNGTSSGIKVIHNYFKNIIGGWPGHHAVMFASVNGGGGSQINFNSFENIHLQSHVDDMVSIYASYGSVNDSIEIIGNWFRGGDYNTANHTGSGITFGDNGGSYIHVKNNIVVNITSGAIGNAGATNTIVENNIIYQSQALANPSNNADGYIMTNFTTNSDTTACRENTWRNNRGLYYISNGDEHTYIALSYAGNKCAKAIGLNTNIVDRTLNASILPQDISRAKAAVTTGTTTGTTITPTVGYKIYPNPVFGKSMVVTLDTLNNEKIAIYNLSGQRIIEQSLTSSRTEINTSNLNTGIYLVMISDNNNKTIEVRKILVTRN
ncbi:MAG: T9SS type A sorting domain-containing protein [Paludibacter sp.]|nr:T9SS type A sorting domain-containing protein [Paludibacter sp.]